MKYVKILGLLAVAAAALMAFAGTASATTLTSAPGTTFTGTLHAENEGHIVLNNPIAKIECSSTVEGPVTQHGAGTTVKGTVSKLLFTPCTNSWHVTEVTGGTLEVHYVSPGIGTVTSNGGTVTTTRLGITCNYSTNNLDIGTLTDSSVTKGTAIFHISTSLLPHTGSSALCGTGAAAWSGTYKITNPMELLIDE